MMRIFFMSGLGKGGAERQVIETSSALAENDIEVTIMTFNIDNCFYELPARIKVLRLDKRTGINQYLPKGVRKVSALFRMRRVIGKEKPDSQLIYFESGQAKYPFQRLICLHWNYRNNSRFIFGTGGLDLSWYWIRFVSHV